jgi:PAS domain S-box-containing protein
MAEENNYHKILQRQISKSLPESYLQDENITAFLNLVSDHYKNIDVDKSFSEHAFAISEREYEQVLLEQKRTNLSLNNSIQKLKQVITDLEPNYSAQFSQDPRNLDDVIDILKNIVAKSVVADENLKIIADATDNFIIRTDVWGKITWLNKAFQKFTGYSLEESAGKTPGSLLKGSETDPAITDMFRKAIVSIKPLNVRTINYTKGGIKYQCDINLSPLFDAKDIHVGFVAIQNLSMDTELLTSRLADANEDLIYQKKLYEEILDKIPVEIGLLDMEKRYRFLNKAAIKDDMVREKIIGMTDLEYVRYRQRPDTLAENRMSHIETVLLGGDPSELTEEHSLPNGSSKFLELRYHFEPGSKYVIGYGIDITDSVNHTKDLKAKNEELQISRQELRKNYDELAKLNSDLDSFIYSTSHNLRSPLTSVQGIANILLEDKLPIEERHFFLNQIKEIIIALEGTILDIIEYSKNTRIDVEYSLIDLEKLATNSFNVNKYYSNYSIDFSVEHHQEANFYSDLKRVTSILDNIISNSIKYIDKKKEKKEIKIKIKINEENCFIELEDNGIGMTQKVLEKAFNMFYRGSNQASGTGLGLFMVKEMLEKIGGHIDVGSDLGVGTKMFLTLKNFKK